MSNLPVCVIVIDAQKDNANRVWAAWGKGPESITRKLCAIAPGATPETPPTHWVMFDATATDADFAIIQGFAAGDLPPLAPGKVWGEDDVISAADALVAVNATNLHAYAASGDVEPLDFLLGKPDGNGVRQGGLLASEGLQYVPDPL